MTPTPARLAALPAAVALLALLSACTGSGSGSDDTAATAEASQAPAAAQDSGRVPGGGGVTGEIAAVSDALLQVQGDDGQTAVTWDDGTTITQTVAGALSDVAVGSCVVVSGADDSGTAATSVAVTAAEDGSCAGGFGGGGGQRPDAGDLPEGADLPDGMPTDMPSGGPGGSMPDGAPTDLPEGGFGGSGVTAGLVTAVDGTTITVEQTVPGADDVTTTTVTVDDGTTYTTTVAADASALAVGRCVAAQGEADDSGKVAATSLTVSDAGDDGCSTGFARRGSGMPGGAPGQDEEAADA